MASIRTHYDNLKVSRDAPAEVIQAAYKSLAAKYHPDVNPGEQSARIMGIINRSYAVISDPEKRAEHDRWIAEAEESRTTRRSFRDSIPRFQAVDIERRFAKWFIPAAIGLFVCLFIGAIAFIVYRSANHMGTPAPQISIAKTAQPGTSTVPPPPPGFTLDQPPAPTRIPVPGAEPKILTAVPKAQPTIRLVPYRRPELGPDGKPWPLVSAYLLDQVENGNSVVVVDNTHNDSDMLVELFDLGLKPPPDVRALFLRAREQFRMEGVTVGRYDIRYQNLDSGLRRKSEPHEIGEHERDSLTLYTVPSGNDESVIIGSDEFDSTFLRGLPRRQ